MRKKWIIMGSCIITCLCVWNVVVYAETDKYDFFNEDEGFGEDFYDNWLNDDDIYMFPYKASKYIQINEYTGWIINAENETQARNEILKKIENNAVIKNQKIKEDREELDNYMDLGLDWYENDIYEKLIALAIADKEDITVSKNEIFDECYDELIEYCDGEVGELLVNCDPEAIPLRVLCNKVMDFLLENNEVIIKGEIETE